MVKKSEEVKKAYIYSAVSSFVVFSCWQLFSSPNCITSYNFVQLLCKS